jgi:uncharacterized protein (TIGR03085 family)
MTSHAVAERFDFADTLAHTKPDAPTLCEPWTAAQLAAHVILRERSLTQAANRLPVDAARRWSNDRIIHYAETVPYDELVRRVHNGPPWWSPLAVPAVADRVNLLEYVVHHEDARRAGPEPSAPRDIGADRRMAIWSQLRLAARLTLRQAPVGVVLVDPHGEEAVARKPVDGQSVVVSGDPVELTLVAAAGRHGRLLRRRDLSRPTRQRRDQTVSQARTGRPAAASSDFTAPMVS